VAAGVYLYRTGLFDPRQWPGQVRRLMSKDPSVMNPALLEGLVVVVIVLLTAQNLWLTVREPHLARPWIAPLLGKEDKQLNIMESYDALLTPNLQPGDVVIAQPMTGWPVPSFGGRLVAALHLEYFAEGQGQRVADQNRFFTYEATDPDRLGILETYDVKWLLLDRERMPPPLFKELFESEASAIDDGRYVLMRAGAWADSLKLPDAEVTP